MPQKSKSNSSKIKFIQKSFLLIQILITYIDDALCNRKIKKINNVSSKKTYLEKNNNLNHSRNLKKFRKIQLALNKISEEDKNLCMDFIVDALVGIYFKSGDNAWNTFNENQQITCKKYLRCQHPKSGYPKSRQLP